jgi:hypothetical protein
MGEFRDMGIPAQVVKKKSCTSGDLLGLTTFDLRVGFLICFWLNIMIFE